MMKIISDHRVSETLRERQVYYRGQVASDGRAVPLSLVGLPQQLQLSAIALQQQQVVLLQVQARGRTGLEHHQQLQHPLRLTKQTLALSVGVVASFSLNNMKLHQSELVLNSQ